MKSVVEAECGGPNPLVATANRLAGRDEGEGSSQRLRPLPVHHASSSTALVREYLAHDPAQTHTFDMAALVHNLQPAAPQTPQTRPLRALPPATDAKAELWARDFHRQRPTARHESWAADYLAKHPSQATSSQRLESAWDAASLPASQAQQQDCRNGQIFRPNILANSEALKWSGEFLSEAESSLDSVEQRAEAWGQEYAAQAAKPTDEDFWSRLESEWMGARGVEEAAEWLDDYQANPAYSEYKFQEENPYVERGSSADPLAEGRARLAEGDLRRAVLLFESAVRQEPTSAEAWLALGQAQAENEQEPAAISALHKALQLRPDLLPARFALATAFTNENLYNDALQSLASWLSLHPAYAAACPPGLASAKPKVASFIDGALFGAVEEGFLRAAAMQEGAVDAELQNALGVLYNLSGNFERAVEALQAGLRVAPEDARLWNRLGATLANGNRSAEAVSAYSRALALYPGFVRARYNLGISCMNLRSSREAVEHFVAALSLQESGMGPQADADSSGAVWSTLRVAVSNLANDSPATLDRDQLVGLVDRRDFQGLSSALGISTPLDVGGANPNAGEPTASVQ